MNIKLRIQNVYQPLWLNPGQANALLATLSALEYGEYKYRAGVLKRAPKREYYVAFEDGTIPIYRWGQNRSEYSQGRPITEIPALDKVRNRINRETGQCCNHCIVIEYSDGKKHHAPPHHDRQVGVDGNGAHDMVAGTSFFVLTLGYARPFQLLDDKSKVVWEERLPHGSLLRVTAEMNRELLHAVPGDQSQPRDCPRYSAIFRTIRKPLATASTNPLSLQGE